MKENFYAPLIEDLMKLSEDEYASLLISVSNKRQQEKEKARKEKIDKTVNCLLSAVDTLLKLEGATATCDRLYELTDEIELKYM